jgi:microcystin-dependent protein
MAQPYVGEIRMFAGNFNPNGWAFCNGQLMPISENETLFQLIGTTYGGDGESTFALPNLQSRLPMHMGTGPDGTTYQLGEMAGVEEVTLTTQQIPVHNHVMMASGNPGQQADPVGNVLASQSPVLVYKPTAVAPTLPMNAQSLTPRGGSQPHDNMHPFLCVNFIISLFGLFPQPT